MENAAYSKEYLVYRQVQEAVFRAENAKEVETTSLPPRYKLRKRIYTGPVGPYTLCATENELVDGTGAVLFTWRNLDDSGEFCSIVEHRDGNRYLIFRIDLYGYSVLNLSTMQTYHFIPSDSFPEGETFIWTDVHYNQENNIMAVSGCYWACPLGTMLLDFSHPMAAPDVWADVQAHIAQGYDRYDDVDFLEWRGTELILSAVDSETGRKETLSLPESQYLKWLQHTLSEAKTPVAL